VRPDDNLTRFELVPYFHGKVLDVSEGRSRAFPHFVGHIDCQQDKPEKLDFATGSFDGVLSSYFLHLCPTDECVRIITEWARVVKPGGHIMLHLPLKHEKELWPVSYDSVVTLMKALPGWDMVQSWRHPEDSAALYVFKLAPKGHAFSWQKPRPAKTCGVVRYGAFGDCIQASSILPWLKSEGYHITFYCSDHGYPVIAHDPHIDRFVIQGRDEVPPQVLGAFWAHEKKKYDKWVNLSGSVEGALLAAEGSAAFDWPNEVRAKYMDVNYLEFTHEIAQVPPPYRPKFYATMEERVWARKEACSFGAKNILWSLSGSSVHKHWPHLDAIIDRVMWEMPDTHVVLVGDEMSQILEDGWQNSPRVHCRSGVWSIRESMAFAAEADLVIGCETGLLNAAGSMETPKIVMLSHSSEEMLTKYWTNVTALRQSGGCPKQPCRQLHMNRDDCPTYEDESIKASLCQYHISHEAVWQALVRVLGETQRKVA